MTALSVGWIICIVGAVILLAAGGATQVAWGQAEPKRKYLLIGAGVGLLISLGGAGYAVYKNGDLKKWGA